VHAARIDSPPAVLSALMANEVELRVIGVLAVVRTTVSDDIYWAAVDGEQ